MKGALASNATTQCTLGANAQSLHSTCMPTFTLKCPANNGDDTTKPFVQKADTPLKCSACAVSVEADAGPSKSQYQTRLKFGNNAVVGGKFNEAIITGYAIHITDADGKVVKDTGVKVPAVGSVDCCQPELYNVFLSGDWPANAAMFAIVPYVGIKNGSSSSEAHFLLPVGTGYVNFTDEGFSAKKVKQNFSLGGMDLASANRLMNDAKSDEILVAGVVAAMKAGGAEVTEPMVKVVEGSKKVTLEASRRLRSAERRLQSKYTLEFQTEATVPAAMEIDADTVTPASLIAAVNAAAKEKAGFNPNILSANVSTPEVGAIIGDTSEGSAATGAAYRDAGSLHASVMVLIAFAGQRFLA